MAGPAQNNSSPVLSTTWSQMGNGPANGPAPDVFHKAPVYYQKLYNEAAVDIGLPQVDVKALVADPLVVRELHRRNTAFHVERNTPQDQAAFMITNATSTGLLGGKSVDTARLANELVAIRRDAPGKAAAIEREIVAQLGNAGDVSRFSEDLQKASGYAGMADAKLRGMANADATKQPTPSRAQLNTDVNAIIRDATSQDTFTVKGEVFPQAVTFSVERVVAQLSALAETDPQKAQLIRSELTARLTPAESGAMNRILAGEGGALERLKAGLNDPGDAVIGAAKGLANDGISIINVIASGSTIQAAAEQEQAAAFSRFLGDEKSAQQLEESAQGLREAAKTDLIAPIPYTNAAQQGGANMVTVLETAGAAKAVYGVGKAAIKHAPDLWKAARGQVDEAAAKGAKGADDLLAGAKAKLGGRPLNSGTLDELYRAGKLNMDEARALAKNAGWKSADGEWIYPPNQGFDAGFKNITVSPGKNVRIDSYGHPGGKFVSPAGASETARALPPGTDFSPGNYHVYEVKKPLPVTSGTATPWFDELGGATQYKLESSVQKLINDGYLVEVTKR